MKKLILLILILFFANITLASPTGYEYYRYQGKDHIHTWNENPLGVNESNIWFKDKSNKPYVQFFNGEDWEEALDRSDWITFNYGIGYYYPSEFRILTANHLNDAEHNITTDNETFWEMNLYKCDNFGDLDYCAGWNRGQQVNDKYMRNSFFFETDDFISPYNTSYLWGFEDIDIGSNSVTDLIRYCFMETDFDTNLSNMFCNVTSLDNTGEFIVYNLTQLYIYDSILEVGHDIFWNSTTEVRLRYNSGEFMLEAPMNIYEGWSGRNEIPMYWIDFGASLLLLVDDFNNYSGYIHNAGFAYTSFRNTNAVTGASRVTAQKDRGFLGFNVSDLPDGITNDNITSVQLLHGLVSVTAPPPTNWRTRFYSASDVNTLDNLDYNKGKLALLVDWDIYCGGANSPCTTYIPLPIVGKSNITDNLIYAKNNDVPFHIITRDNSLYGFPDVSWTHITGVVSREKSYLEINFTIPNYIFNITLDFPGNNSNFIINSTSEVIEFPLNGTNHGEYLSDRCTFTSNDGVLFLNTTQVDVNNSIGYGYYFPNITRYSFNDNGSKWWEANCTDLWGTKAYSGRYNFNITKSLPPSVQFLTQVPADIDTFNILGHDALNITYNITDNQDNLDDEIDLSTVFLYHQTNNSIDDCWIISNGTPMCGYMPRAYTYNLSSHFSFQMSDNEVYPGTYNFNEMAMETTAHSIYTLSGQNRYVKVQLKNVSNLKNFTIFEAMINNTNPTGTRSLRLYYCNSSYSTGSPVVNSNCINFYNLDAQSNYNHTHTVDSSHIVAPVPIVAGHLGDVLVTPTSYFLLRGQGGIHNWDLYYIQNDTETAEYTTNNGIAWTPFVGTIDSHIHQYDGSEFFKYYVCANDTTGKENCSNVRIDKIELGGIPPSSPFVYFPTLGTYSGFTFINWTAAVSPNGYEITGYNITLLDFNESFVQNILLNTSNLSYYWNTSEAYNGDYIIQVYACDELDQCSFGLSENITILNQNITVSIGALKIIPNIKRYPLAIRNLTLHELIIIQNNQIFPNLKFNKTLNMSIFPNRLGYPIVRK